MPEHVGVIGSGPAAMACAHALEAAGRRVSVIDVGLGLDDEAARLLDRYREDRDRERLLAGVHALRARHASASSDQPGKYLFGSDHPYRTLPCTEVEAADDVVVRSSLGKGGLTAVWGATVAPVIPTDIADWPITFADLEPHYRALENIVPVSAPPGEMDIYPIDLGTEPTFPLGAQGQALLDSLRAHRGALLADGIHCGRAKLAVGARYSIDGRGCTPCGLCMHGCPNRAIFSAEHLLDDLRRRPRVEYLGGLLAESFAETDQGVELSVLDVATHRRDRLAFDRVFIGCGVINSTALVARSLGMTDHTFTILDSQKYIYPLLTRRVRGAVRAADNTLAQVYLTVANPSVSRHAVQVQYYGYNDIILDPVRARLGQGAARAFARLAAPLLERLMIAFVYLHSNDSGHLSLRVHRTTDAGLGTITGATNPRSEAVLGALLALLGRHSGAHRGRALRRGVRATRPGDSQHIGGTLPMAAHPGRHDTDLLGRPAGCRRVHVVDASVMPSVPATPIAFTAMANATRIAAGAVQEASR